MIECMKFSVPVKVNQSVGNTVGWKDLFYRWKKPDWLRIKLMNVAQFQRQFWTNHAVGGFVITCKETSNEFDDVKMGLTRLKPGPSSGMSLPSQGIASLTSKVAACCIA